MRYRWRLLLGVGAAFLAGSYLYGVLGPAPTAPAGQVVAPAGVSGTITPRDANGPLRILLVGTSLTARGNWPETLEAKLSACAPRGVEITRLARPGASIRWGLPALAQRLENKSESLPDIVVVEFAGNDASLNHGLPLFLAKSRTLNLLRVIQGTGAVAFLSTMNPGWAGEWVTRPGQARYHGLYRDIASESGAGLIDTAPEWLSLPREVRRRLVPDGGHPSDEGMMQIAIPAFVHALHPLVCG